MTTNTEGGTQVPINSFSFSFFTLPYHGINFFMICTALKRSVTSTVPFTTKEYSHTRELLKERSNTRLKHE